MAWRALAARVAYGAAFVAGVPLLLVLWARASADRVGVPGVHAPVPGVALTVAGVALTLTGMRALVRHGRGLPMNAFPPPVFVRRGVFGWLGHPIYVGFGLAVLGLALATGSASGLWLVTPTVWLAMTALVLGYEQHDLRRRFGAAAAATVRLSLPPLAGTRPPGIERVATAVVTFVPWLTAYYAVQALGRPPDAVPWLLPGESGWPVVEWMELPYVSAYLLVPLSLAAAPTRRDLRLFAMSGLAATAAFTLCWLVLPAAAAHRAFEPATWWGTLIVREQADSHGVAAFPSFHVLWPMLAARAATAGRGAAARAAAWSWAALVGVSAVLTGHHAVVDVAAGAAAFVPFAHPGRSWARVQGWGETIANSWHEWRVGPVRFISHGVYAGLAAAVGMVVAGAAGGTEAGVAWVGLWVLVGAGLYAQVLEGSSRLLRPFGWYGGVLGAMAGIATASLVGASPLALLGGFAVAAPWVQLVGRLRCLVQGCCHGAPAPKAWGIRYRHPRSRVWHVASLRGIPVYPTPLYSMAANLVIGLLLVRLRTLNTPDVLVAGVYLILSSCARFVEESYRGEPQTPIVAGLHVYQWLAVATLLAGVAVTMVPVAAAGAWHAPSSSLVAGALVMGLIYAAAMGLDFPGSSRRFSRLAPAE
ncbi:MAG: prolipoprotein diacylglyceryl transferase family protein [Vicinamibacterales bacterium]